jgi:hypothetical protein
MSSRGTRAVTSLRVCLRVFRPETLDQISEINDAVGDKIDVIP